MKRTQRFTESEIISDGRPDRNDHVIHGVKILGTESKNGRFYPLDVLRESAVKYNGARVYFDHTDNDTPNHSVTNLFGRLENVRCESDGLYADLKYNPEHIYTEQLLYQIENEPDEIGMSPHHDAVTETLSDGTLKILEITQVYSVDIVDHPATTGGMFESEDPLTPPQKGECMDWEKITLEDLNTNRPDLVQAIQAGIAEDLKQQNELLSVAIEDVITAEEPVPVTEPKDDLEEEDDEEKKKDDEEEEPR